MGRGTRQIISHHKGGSGRRRLVPRAASVITVHCAGSPQESLSFRETDGVCSVATRERQRPPLPLRVMAPLR